MWAVTIFLFSRIAVRGNWVRFLYNPIHVLCMQQFHSILPFFSECNCDRIGQNIQNEVLLKRSIFEEVNVYQY